MSAIKQIEMTGILPVIGIGSTESAVPLADALSAGGVDSIEVTLRSDCALEAIRLIKQAHPEMAVGAGTVLSSSQADAAIASGADFLVSPGFNPKTVEYALSKGVPMIPGCVTASDIELGISMGLKLFKYFPAEQMGGLAAIKLLSGPFKDARFIPTGGLNFSLLPEYLACPAVLACGGSYMAPGALIKAGKWEEITALCRKAISLSMGFELAHIGINHSSAIEAEATAEWFCRAFGTVKTEHEKSVFAGTMVESMKSEYAGAKGHIAVSTASMVRAMAHLEKEGFAFRDDLKGVDAGGRPVWAYFADEVGGFAVHLFQR